MILYSVGEVIIFKHGLYISALEHSRNIKLGIYIYIYIYIYISFHVHQTFKLTNCKQCYARVI